MKTRSVTYFSKNKALKIFESPLNADLKTLLSATFKLTRNKVVKRHIEKTLHQLETPVYKLSA